MSPLLSRAWCTGVLIRRASIAVVFLVGLATGGDAAAAPSIFSFGYNRYGRTGLNTDVGNTLVATPIDATNLADKSIMQVAAGTYHSLLLADDGTVLSFGLNVVAGQNTNNGNTLVATQIDTTNLAGKTIRQVAASSHLDGIINVGQTVFEGHSLLLATDGTVFSFGANFFGQTGLGTSAGSALIATPIDTTNLAGKTIAQIAAGTSHSLLLADDGTVFSFGYNYSGATGRGIDSGNTLVATPIDATNLSGKTITQIAAGDSHSLLLADDGMVFSFGDGTLIATPIDMTNLSGKKITQIAAGSWHSLMLASDGTVFSFGNNTWGQIGRSGDPSIAAPIDGTNLAGKPIVQIAAGQDHNLLLADDGTVFAFGSNWGGQTGLGTNVGNTLIATPIDTMNLIGSRVIGISAGGSHSLLLVLPEPKMLPLFLFPAVLTLRRKRLIPSFN